MLFIECCPAALSCSRWLQLGPRSDLAPGALQNARTRHEPCGWIALAQQQPRWCQLSPPLQRRHAAAATCYCTAAACSYSERSCTQTGAAYVARRAERAGAAENSSCEHGSWPSGQLSAFDGMLRRTHPAGVLRRRRCWFAHGCCAASRDRAIVMGRRATGVEDLGAACAPVAAHEPVGSAEQLH